MIASGGAAQPRARGQRDLLRIVLDHVPDLVVRSVASAGGQFNDVLIVNDEFVFRFPRTDDAAKDLAAELAVLPALQGWLPVAVPDPAFSAFDDERRPMFMGYRLLPGSPLDRPALEEIRNQDPTSFEQLGIQVGRFLKALHGMPAPSLASGIPASDHVAFWTDMLDAFSAELFEWMRPDARREVVQGFEAYVSDPANIRWIPVLRHGDLGGANLLYDRDERRLSGVIDFGSVALGDPAVDLAAISSFHPGLALAMRPAYPEIFAPDVQRRVAFYQSTFALQQALWARRSGDADEFNDGIAAYR